MNAMTTAIAAYQGFLPSDAVMISASTTPGKASRMSVARMMTASTPRPNVALSTPITEPISSTANATESPIAMSIRAAAMHRRNTSRP